MRYFPNAAIGIVLALAVFAASCGGSGENEIAVPSTLAATDTDSDSETTQPESAETGTTPSATGAATTLDGIQSSIGEPVAADPSAVELDEEEVNIATRVVSVVADEGTPGEIPFHVAIPEDWTFDAAIGGFTDGQSTMTFVTGCEGDCVAKSWPVALQIDGGFLDFQSHADFGSSISFASSSSRNGGSSSVGSDKDDGSGRSITAHYVNDAARFIGCSVVLAPGGQVTLRTYTELCQSMVIDWNTLIANTPEATINVVITDEITTLLEAPDQGLEYQIVALDDEGEHSIRVALPADATATPGTFGTEVRLGDDWSIFTDLSFDSTCDGICQEQDWESVLNETGGMLGRIRAATNAENDTPIPGGWLISGPSVTDEDEYNIVVTRWSDESNRFFVCEAEVSSRDKSRANELIGICLSAVPDWIS